MRFAYQYNGAPLLQWNRSAPAQSRASDTVSLGSLGGTSLAGSTLSKPTLVLPLPGAPEPIDITHDDGMGGCDCSGRCGCVSFSGIEAIPSWAKYGALAAAVFVAWKCMKR